MPTVVLDASIVVSAALKRGSLPERAVLHATRVDTLCLSRPVLDEYRDVLGRPKFRAALSDGQRERILVLLTAAAIRVDPTVTVSDCPDPKDNKYLELAMAAE